nr:MAG TPA: Oligo alginate lyase [Caudoviricetes sp.]
MERFFQINSIEASLKEQSLFITLNADVDEATVNDDNLILMNKASRAMIPFDIFIDRKVIQLKLKRWAEPNSEYILIVEAGIKSLVGTELESSISRKIIFKSEILNGVRILNPINFESMTDIEELKVRWEETLPPRKKKKYKRYRIEISKDQAFINQAIETYVDVDSENYEMVFNEFSLGQFFIRMRVEDNDQYGPWSEVISFTIKSSKQPKDPTILENEPETERPELPTIVDYTKQIKEKDEKEKNPPPEPPVKIEPEQLIFNDLSQYLTFICSGQVDDTNATVEVWREEF